MATAFTPINSGAPALPALTARAYADGVDIHTARLENGVFTPPHDLRGCTRFQWQYNALDGSGWMDLSGPMAITDTWQVDESRVESSGAYRCIIRIGEDPDCTITTDERTIAIVDCGDVTPITFPNAGGLGSRTISIRFPHFVRNRVTITSPDWITHTDIVCAETSGVCDEISTLTAAARSENAPRNGYVDVMIGDFLCAFPVQQQYGNAAPDPVGPVDATPPLGPSLSILNVNPDVVIDSTATLLVNASIVNSDGTFTPLVGNPNWMLSQDGVTANFYEPGTDIFNPNPPPPRPYWNFLPTLDPTTRMSTIGVVFDTSTIGRKTMSITVTANGISVTDSDSINVSADASDTQAGSVSGETFGSGSARPNSSFLRQVQNMLLDDTTRMITNEFSVDGGTATLTINLSSTTGLNQSFPYVGDAVYRITVSGPDVPGGSRTNEIRLPPGDPPPPRDGSPGSIAFGGNNMIVDTRVFTTRSDGRLGPGNYTIEIEITSAGARPGQRVINAVFNPSFTYTVTPFFNFGGL